MYDWKLYRLVSWLSTSMKMKWHNGLLEFRLDEGAVQYWYELEDKAAVHEAPVDGALDAIQEYQTEVLERRITENADMEDDDEESFDAQHVADEIVSSDLPSQADFHSMFSHLGRWNMNTSCRLLCAFAFFGSIDSIRKSSGNSSRHNIII